MQIHVDPGGYVPRFEHRQASAESAAPRDEPVETGARGGRGTLPGMAVGAALVLVAAVVVLPGARSWTAGPDDPSDAASRSALRDQSMLTLQAANMADEARRLLFPLLEVKRQQIALDMFLHATELSPDLSDGYAGAAQVQATLALLSVDPAQRSRLLELARDSAAQALRRAPDDVWPIAADAWVAAVEGRSDRALHRARTALKLAPENGYILDLVGISAIVAGNAGNAGNAGLAAEASDPGRERKGEGRFGANNIWGVSTLMLGRYADTVRAFELAPTVGAPVSAPSLIFLAIAHDHLGQPDRAHQLIGELNRTWPEFPTVFLIDRIFGNSPELARDLRDRLGRLGVSSALALPEGSR